MTQSIGSYTGLRAVKLQAKTTQKASAPAPFKFCVEANKKVAKKVQVVLTKDGTSLGAKGDLTFASAGYYRNFLEPYGYARKATQEVLDAFQAKLEAEEKEKAQVKKQSLVLAKALQTIGKFVIRKKAGEEKQIFGSVTAKDVIETVRGQTSQVLESSQLDIPDVKTLGLYDVSAQLHPEVKVTFQINVMKE